jgi:hypothetical protein
MNSEILGYTISSTGNHTVLLNGGFTPLEVESELGPRTGTNETDIRFSTGHTDFTNSFARAITSNPITRESNSYCVMHYQGTTKKISATPVSTASGQFTFNWDVIDSAYSHRGVARG